MNWFYAKEGQQAGPVDDAEFDRLVSAGDIADSTLVWHSGLPNWLPYATARITTTGGAPGFLASTVRLGPGQAQCSQCGRVLPADEVVRIDHLNVCAECKPGFLQRLREGAPLPNAGLTALLYAGFWIRFGAALLDGIILIPFYLLLGMAFWFLTELHTLDFLHVQPQQIARITQRYLPYSILIRLLLACYSAFCLSRFGGTPGKRICGLRVIHGDHRERVTFLRGLGRYAAKMIPRVIFGLFAGFLPRQLFIQLVWSYVYPLTDSLFIVFDARRRSLHDMICDTRVVHDPR